MKVKGEKANFESKLFKQLERIKKKNDILGKFKRELRDKSKLKG